MKYLIASDIHGSYYYCEKVVEAFKKEEARLLPENMDYHAIAGLRLEARDKLAEIRPMSIGQASRILSADGQLPCVRYRFLYWELSHKAGLCYNGQPMSPENPFHSYHEWYLLPNGRVLNAMLPLLAVKRYFFENKVY